LNRGNASITTQKHTKEEFIKARKQILDSIQKHKLNIYEVCWGFDEEAPFEEGYICVKLRINTKKVIN